MPNYIFGNIQGIKEGQLFENRSALREYGIHLATMAGIDGSLNAGGATSIVLNGGYIDDLDLGNEIIYTGHGGNDLNTKKQIADQSWDATGNKALLVNELHGIPVRVTRGYKHKSQYSPSKGYKYAGLYNVVTHFEEIGKDGFKICRYKLIKVDDSAENIETESTITSNGSQTSKRVSSSVLRIVRDTRLSIEIKKHYNYECQVCGIVIEVKGIRYAEAAHIKPLGTPHNGTDTPDNLICLCPNHHVMLDKGIYTIDKELNLVGIKGKISLKNNHVLNTENLEYHISHIYLG